jgi:hypothetical protein
MTEERVEYHILRPDGMSTNIVGRGRLMLSSTHNQQLFFLLFRSLFRLGCTLFGSPGIFG